MSVTCQFHVVRNSDDCETSYMYDILSETTQGGAETEGSILPTDPEALVMRKLLLSGLSQVSFVMFVILVNKLV